nr:2Fe-2S iron-sulfur cluster-binding protein [Nocardia otitidiscaviarum]
MFRTERDQLAARHPGITIDHVIAEPSPDWTGRTGFLTAGTIATLAGPLHGRMVYACGAQALDPFALVQLTALGQPRKRIRFEANGAPTEPSAQPHWPAGVDPSEEVTVTVGANTFRSRRDRPLLDALEDNGIRPEAACRSGECSLGRMRVVERDAHRRRGQAAAPMRRSATPIPASPTRAPMWRSIYDFRHEPLPK